MLLKLLLFITSFPDTFCVYNTCNSVKDTLEECYNFKFNENGNDLSQFEIKLNESLQVQFLNVSFQTQWKYALLRVSPYSDPTENYCANFTSSLPNNCLGFSLEDEGKPFLLQYKIGGQSKDFSRKIAFSVPRFCEKFEIFTYVDFTDTANLNLKIQPLPEVLNVSDYKVEAWREKRNTTLLLDLRIFSSKDQSLINFNYFTYNEEGAYIFTVSALDDRCDGGTCLKTTTPKIYIGRKNTPYLIGIVGASFILPFVLFIFHTFAKKYKIQDEFEQSNQKILILYQKSSKKHNDVVDSLAKLLTEFSRAEIILEVIPLAKIKEPEPVCEDILLLPNDIIYIAPPLSEESQELRFSIKETRISNIVFGYSATKLPTILNEYKKFKLFEDFGAFIKGFNRRNLQYENHPLYADLKQAVEDAKNETNDSVTDAEALPMIIVTDSESQEEDKLLSPQFHIE